MRITRERSPRYDKKSRFNQNQVSTIFSIRVVNENQQVVLMRINKSILLRNENGYRFHSHHSKVILNLRNQSTTIPNTLIAKGLYIYKKWKCVESLTIPGKGLHYEKPMATLGTSITYNAY